MNKQETRIIREEFLRNYIEQFGIWKLCKLMIFHPIKFGATLMWYFYSWYGVKIK